MALAGLALLAAWTGLSYEWAPLGGRAQDDVQRLLLYLGFFAASLALVREPLARRLVEPGVALGAFVVTVYGLSGRLVPGLADLDRSVSADGRLEQPLTYWNAMGCLAAIGLVVCLRIAADGRRHHALRAAAAFAAPGARAGRVPQLLARGAAGARGRRGAAGGAGAVGADQIRAGGVILGAGLVAGLVASRLSRVETLAPAQGAESGQGAGDAGGAAPARRRGGPCRRARPALG